MRCVVDLSGKGLFILCFKIHTCTSESMTLTKGFQLLLDLREMIGLVINLIYLRELIGQFYYVFLDFVLSTTWTRCFKFIDSLPYVGSTYRMHPSILCSALTLICWHNLTSFSFASLEMMLMNRGFGPD